VLGTRESSPPIENIPDPKSPPANRPRAATATEAS
jgi:hypothetical protein